MRIRAGSFLLPEYRTKRITLKQEDGERTVVARFATLGVVDFDGDIIEAGAIGDQEVLLGNYNHDFQGNPPGYGDTYESRTEALFRGTFLDTISGNDTYQTLKQLDEAGRNMEWSFRFFVEDGGFETRDGEDYFIIRKARVTHVAPVESGAGINTATLDVKACGPECQAAKDGKPADIYGVDDFAKAVNATLAKARERGKEKGSMQIDYAKLADALAPAILSAIKAEAEKAGTGSEEVKSDCDCGKAQADCGCNEADADKGTDDGWQYKGGVLFVNGQRYEVNSEQLTQFITSGELPDPMAAETASPDQDAGQTAAADTPADPVANKGQSLGDLIRLIRDEKELSNEDLADAAGLSVSSIGGILAGTNRCPKVGQLQGLARRLGVSLSRLVSAAEEDGCTDYGGSESSAADQGQDKAGDEQGDSTVEIKSGDEVREMSDPEIAKQVEDLMSGFPGLPPDTDPGLIAWGKFQTSVLIEQEA